MNYAMRALAITALLSGFAFGATAQTPQPSAPVPLQPERPPLAPFRSVEDYIFLRSPDKRIAPLDRLKFIPLSSDKYTYLTLGGEYRIEYEYLHYTNFGAGPQSGDGYALQRAIPLLDLHVGSHLRWFTQFQVDDDYGRAGGPRPGIDRDLGDFNEGFLEIASNNHATKFTSLRTGRQELVFGSNRLVDINEGVTVRSAFDGFRFTSAVRSARLDVIAVRPVLINPGLMDDAPDHTKSFWGLYSTVRVPKTEKMAADAYYLGLDSKSSTYEHGTAREIRHSAGVRVFNHVEGSPFPAGFDYNWELTGQWGAFGASSIFAWMMATETGYRSTQTLWRPRFVLKADAASGDRNPHGHTLGTFNPLFPRGGYFGNKLVLEGPYNFFDLHPEVQLEFTPRLTAQADWDFFWRESTSDGLYLIGDFENVPASVRRTRYIGSQENVEFRYALNRYSTIALNQAVFLPGDFLKGLNPHKGVVFFNFGTTFRF